MIDQNNLNINNEDDTKDLLDNVSNNQDNIISNFKLNSIHENDKGNKYSNIKKNKYKNNLNPCQEKKIWLFKLCKKKK